MIRSEKARFLDNILKLFDGVRKISKKELELKYQHDTYFYIQTEKHLKILEADGMIICNVLDEYYLQPQGSKVLNDIENLGYLAKHKLAAAEYERMEEEEEDGWDFPFSFIPLQQPKDNESPGNSAEWPPPPDVPV